MATKTKKPKKVKPPAAVTGASSTGGRIRVRMYCVGFGDFFLVTFPCDGGDAHVLIDCGVTTGSTGVIDQCVTDVLNETGGKLALIIATHKHMDHLKGFDSSSSTFKQFNHIGAIWLSNRLDPKNETAVALTNQLESVATQLRTQLTLRLNAAKEKEEKEDEVARAAMLKISDALGFDLDEETGLPVAGGGYNDRALKLLREDLKPAHAERGYYQGGDKPFMPPELAGVTADILSPAPFGDDKYSVTDNRPEQYIAALHESGVPSGATIDPFDDMTRWTASAAAYRDEAFLEFHVEDLGRQKARELFEERIASMQSDALAAAADSADGTLNNQSLVVLFTFKGKRLLFVGDAQWGNWCNWLYQDVVKGKDPGITETARQILGSLDFYKVGHHGSTNATPIPAVGALNQECSGMCSTSIHNAWQLGTKKNIKFEVPRAELMQHLEERTGSRVVRSDWIAVGDTAYADDARTQLGEKLPKGFEAPEGKPYIDFYLDVD